MTIRQVHRLDLNPSYNDVMGDHAISCAIGGERISKHNHVRDAIF